MWEHQGWKHCIRTTALLIAGKSNSSPVTTVSPKAETPTTSYVHSPPLAMSHTQLLLIKAALSSYRKREIWKYTATQPGFVQLNAIASSASPQAGGMRYSSKLLSMLLVSR